ncbi:hypothetical protein QE435_000036 [Rhizobium sp. SORGH_AS 787]|nr:hypothetical protein [Rhizobium sp. SORGH_AS_0787]
MSDSQISDALYAALNHHYRNPHVGLLLLSDIGASLTASKIWPAPTENRRLKEIIEDLDGMSLRCDRGFVVVVPNGYEQRADQVIEERRRLEFLRSLPKGLLLAFTTIATERQVVGVGIRGKLFYEAAAILGTGVRLVDDDLRVPGMEVSDLPSQRDDLLKLLYQNIHIWCDRHCLDPHGLAYHLLKNRSKT